METLLLWAALSAIFGSAIGFTVRTIIAKSELKERQKKGDEIINKAKSVASDVKYRARREAKDIAREEKENTNKKIQAQQNEILNQEKSISKKEVTLEQKIEMKNKELTRINEKEKELNERDHQIESEIEKYKKKQAEITDRLSEISSMSKEDAKNELLSKMEEIAKVDFGRILKRIEEETKEEAEKKAKSIISTAIQRFSGEYVAESTISTVELQSDDIKGRLIGREGRNIRSFEQICGVNLIIDDTPEVAVISSFNVIRKEIARLTIEKLIADGRIHPAKIEEFYEKSKQEMDKQLREYGEKAQMELGLHGIHPEILKLVGALNWRTSYTQNQFQHATETAFLCGAMAAEVGLNVKQARRAGLLHDVGKVLDASQEGSHAIVGANFLKRYGESADIIHAVRAHHDDEKPESILAHLVSAADALSGARPGARKSMMESYVSRLSDIEEIVKSFEGVSGCYAISGGREVRVLVENKRVSDEETFTLSHDIAKKIESEMSYPGTIKVTVLRETIAVGVAK